MQIETLEDIRFPARPTTDEVKAALNLAFELVKRKPGGFNTGQLYAKFRRFFATDNDRISLLGREFERAHAVNLGLFGRPPGDIQREILELGIRAHLQALSRQTGGKQIPYIRADKAFGDVNRWLEAINCGVRRSDPATAANMFRRINAELGSPVKIIAKDPKELGRLIGKAPRLSTRSRTNILRTKRHPPPM